MKNRVVPKMLADAATVAMMAVVWLAVALIGPMELAAQIFPTYEYELLVLHPRGSYNSNATKMNAATREAVGFSFTHYVDDGQALLWTGAGTAVRSLSPGTGYASKAHGIDGNYIGGMVKLLNVWQSEQAWAWGVYNNSSISLHPPGMHSSEVTGVGGGKFVGWAVGAPTNWSYHAMLWTSAEAGAAVNLHPSRNFLASQANDIDRYTGQQVGSGTLIRDVESEPGGGGARIKVQLQERALLWNGSAASVIDLHPSRFDSSEAWAADEGRQVGHGVPAGGLAPHALLWNGTAASVVDLHPAGFQASQATGISGDHQVGFAWGADEQWHAILWQGRFFMVDLHSFLPPEQYALSLALDVDEYGHVLGSAQTQDGESHAVMWRRRPDLVGIWNPGPANVQGGRYVRLLVALNGPALGDAKIELASSAPTIGVVPLSRMPDGPFEGTIVPSGSLTTTDGIWVPPVDAPTPVTITATYRGVHRSITFTVVPAKLASISLVPAQVKCGQPLTGIVTLDSATGPSGAVVQLTGTTNAAVWPGASPTGQFSVTIPPYASRATCEVATWVNSPAAGTVRDTVSATLGNITRQASLECIP